MDKKRIEKLVKGAIADTKDDLIEDGGEDLSEEAKKMEQLEMKEIEKIIEDKHANFSKISRHYKLFEYVARANPEQVLRYIKQRTPGVEPLWMSEKGTPEEIPKCPRCGSTRLFECQIMPQIFD